MKVDPNAPLLSFETSELLEQWFAKNHAIAKELWVRMYKKASGKQSINWSGALDVALCYGWIDGIRKAYDSESFIQRFTPRRPKGNWSKINTEHIARLIKLGKMRPSGLLEVENAKKDGRWEAAYDSPANIKIPDDFLGELKKHKKAYEFFLTLNKTNKFAIVYRLQTAKKVETLQRRKEQILAMLEKGEKFY